MILENIITDILDEIESINILSREELQRCLEISNANGKPHCTFFLLKARKDANSIVEEFHEALKNKEINKIKDITVRGPSISFNINMEIYNKMIIEEIITKDEKFGESDIGNNKVVTIDYSSPNIAKVFHIGHFRTTVLGNFIRKLYKFCGYKVVGINYLGDWGKQFGYVLLGFEKYGSEEKLKVDPIKHLFDVYVAIYKESENDPNVDIEAKKIFEKMEKNNDEKYMSLWRRFRELSISKYKKLYERIGVEFDVYSGESVYEKVSKDIVQNIEFAVKNDDGSICLDLNENNKPTILKSDGTTLYLTRDIAAAIDRVNTYSPEKMLYVVSSEQASHFEQLFMILRKMNINCKDLEHVSYGLVSGMSTRKGTVKFLEEIIDTAQKVMLQEINSNPEKAATIEDINSTSLILAVSTLVVMDFSAKRIKGYEFDIEKRAKNVNGTGPYFQYAHCRLKSIEEKNSELDLEKPLSEEYLKDEIISTLMYKLLWFEKNIILCLSDYEPSRIVTYLNDLCSYVNSINSKFKVKGEETELARTRLMVFKCARIVIGNALRLFGLTPLNKM